MSLDFSFGLESLASKRSRLKAIESEAHRLARIGLCDVNESLDC